MHLRRKHHPNQGGKVMIHAGDTLYNPVTGERMTFLATSADTGGEYVKIELRADPGAVVAAAHVHPAQEERFEILSGVFGAKIDRHTYTAYPGNTLLVDPGVAHKWWNAGDTELVFRCTVSPALEFESLIETMFSLAADGKTNKKGMPNPLRLAVIARHHLDDVVLPGIPVWMQKAALALGAPMGRMLGYGATYDGGGKPAALVPAPAAG
jgi:mannose-6-phosphate isomerase-like protein (cupin superfamily)